MKYLLLILFFSTTCLADATIGIGLGRTVFEKNGTPFERMVAVGYQHVIDHDFFIRPEAGYFMDNSGNGKSSFWVAPLMGVRALPRTGSELHLAVGPGYLNTPDSVLGGHFQFSLEGGVGLTDKRTYIGIAWKHLSSAGFEMPNMGRDFITIQLRIFAL